LTPKTGQNKVDCTNAGQIFTITNFADFSTVYGSGATFSVTITELTAPTNSGSTSITKDLIDTIITNDGTGNIDNYTNDGNDDVTINVKLAAGTSKSVQVTTSPPAA
jgi:hypothetical protein